MATPGEGYGGGGGKFQKKPLRRSQKTPYDRPTTALRNPTNNGWLSKLVNPASKLISASANMFFSSVFQKRLPPLLQEPPPPPLSEDAQEPEDEIQEVPLNSPAQAKYPDSDLGGDLTDKSNGTGISELEQILKQKSFTRSEIERLTELLHSRTIELPVRNEGKLSEANCSNPPSNYQRHEAFSFRPMQESREERNKLISSPVGTSRVAEVDITSAAELAKAYMGSRPSKVSSPSMLGLRSQTSREDATFWNDVSFLPKSPITSLVSKSDFRENGFVTPRSRGRSAMYNMARTPYSRGHPTSVAQQGTRSIGYGFSGPSLTPRGWEQGGQSGTKQLALKRRSSTLDEDVGSVGPIRRIRQKSNLSTQDVSKYKISKSVEGKGDNAIASSSYVQQVPSKSSQVAAKILEHLERMTPKEKSSESKQIFNKSPTKLTPDMLSGQALKSLGDVDSSKLFKDPQLLSPDKVNVPNSTSLNQDKAKVNGPKTSEVTAATVNIFDVKTTDVPNIALQPLQKKRAFQMSADEDTKEADGHLHSNGFGFEEAKGGEGVGKPNKAASFPTSGVSSELLAKAVVSVVEADKASPPVNSAAGFMFATSSAQAAQLTHSITSSADKVVPPTELNASSSLFTSMSKNADIKLSPVTFSSPFANANANEFSTPKSGFQLHPKPETSESAATIPSGLSDSQPKILEADNKKTQNAEDVKRNVQALPFSTVAASTTSMFSPSSSSGENSNPNNGSSPSKFSIFTSSGPLIASVNTSKKRMIGDLPSLPSFVTSSSTSVSVSVSAPLTAPPLFGFGSSSTPSTTMSGVAKISKEKKVDATSFPTPTFLFTSAPATSKPLLFSSGNSSGESLFSAASPLSSSASKSSTTAPFQFGGSSIFGASASTNTSTVSPLFGAPATASGSLFGSSTPSFGNASSSSSSAASAVSSASPNTFGSSWQTNTFGTSSPSPVFSFGSSSSAATTPVSSLFGGSSAAAAASAPVFSFTSVVAANQQQQQPVFGFQGSSALFSSPALSSGDQMSVEDSMAEDQPVQQRSSPATPVFSTAPGFVFGSAAATPVAAPSASVPFQFGGQTTSPFQASGSLDFNAGGGGSFSLGSNGGDKSGRRIVRASKSKNRKK